MKKEKFKSIKIWCPIDEDGNLNLGEDKSYLRVYFYQESAEKMMELNPYWKDKIKSCKIIIN